MKSGFNVVNATLLMIGILLIIAGVKGKQPLDVLRDSLGMKSGAGAQPRTQAAPNPNIRTDPFSR